MYTFAPCTRHRATVTSTRRTPMPRRRARDGALAPRCRAGALLRDDARGARGRLVERLARPGGRRGPHALGRRRAGAGAVRGLGGDAARRTPLDLRTRARRDPGRARAGRRADRGLGADRGRGVAVAWREPRPVAGPLLLGDRHLRPRGERCSACGSWPRTASDSINVRGAWLHVLSDTLGSVGAMTAGALIWAFGWSWADPLASLAICALVLYSAWHLLREVVDVLMEAAPRELDVGDVHAALARLARRAQRARPARLDRRPGPHRALLSPRRFGRRARPPPCSRRPMRCSARASASTTPRSRSSPRPSPTRRRARSAAAAACRKRRG